MALGGGSAFESRKRCFNTEQNDPYKRQRLSRLVATVYCKRNSKCKRNNKFTITNGHKRNLPNRRWNLLQENLSEKWCQNQTKGEEAGDQLDRLIEGMVKPIVEMQEKARYVYVQRRADNQPLGNSEKLNSLIEKSRVRTETILDDAHYYFHIANWTDNNRHLFVPNKLEPFDSSAVKDWKRCVEEEVEQEARALQNAISTLLQTSKETEQAEQARDKQSQPKQTFEQNQGEKPTSRQASEPAEDEQPEFKDVTPDDKTTKVDGNGMGGGSYAAQGLDGGSDARHGPFGGGGMLCEPVCENTGIPSDGTTPSPGPPAGGPPSAGPSAVSCGGAGEAGDGCRDNGGAETQPKVKQKVKQKHALLSDPRSCMTQLLSALTGARFSEEAPVAAGRSERLRVTLGFAEPRRVAPKDGATISMTFVGRRDALHVGGGGTPHGIVSWTTPFTDPSAEGEDARSGGTQRLAGGADAGATHIDGADCGDGGPAVGLDSCCGGVWRVGGRLLECASATVVFGPLPLPARRPPPLPEGEGRRQTGGGGDGRRPDGEQRPATDERRLRMSAAGG